MQNMRMGEEKEAIKQPDHDMMFVVFSTLLTVTVRKTVQYCKSLSAGGRNSARCYVC